MEEDKKARIEVHIGGNATANTFGDNASVDANTIIGSIHDDPSNQQNLEKLFNKITQIVSLRSEDSTVDKEEITEAIEKLRSELEKRSDENIIRRRLRSIGRMAPDILDVIIETFKAPASGMIEVARKIAIKVKGEIDRK